MRNSRKRKDNTIHRVYLGLLIVGAVLFMGLKGKKDNIHLYLAGDSTMADKLPGAYPETGWGSRMRNMFDSTVTIVNKAQNGRSTKTFMSSGLWLSIENSLQKGDFVMIQFGHNDEISTKESFTTESVFRKNLEFFVSQTRKKGAFPILMTPVARRKFDDKGNIIDTHSVYAKITVEVASSMGVVLFDINKQSMDFFQKTGPEYSKLYFNYLQAEENPNYPKGKQDDTHLDELGARKIAELVISDLRQSNCELTKRIIIGNQGIK